MTTRSLVLGLLAAVFVAGVGYLNDSVLGLSRIVGNHFPISVFGLLILCVIVLNPLLGLLGVRRRFRAGELAVIVALMLVPCFIPGSGLMRTFVPSLALPVHYNDRMPGWKKTDVLSYVPPAMLPADGGEDAEVLDPLFGGKAQPGQTIGLTDVPWGKWRRSLTVWLPLVALLAVGGICIGLIVHPQWSTRERLRYPVAQFARSLMPSGAGSGPSSILRSRLFWMGLAAILAIRVINGLNLWDIIKFEIPLRYDLTAVAEKYPEIARIPGSWSLFYRHLYPTIIAFSFFLATDVAFSLGICQVLYVAVMGVLMTQGIRARSTYMTGGGFSWQYFGSYLGIALLVAYTGRRHYAGVLKRALLFRRQEGVEGYAVWACRIGLLAAAAAVAILIGLGLDWPFAVLLVLLILLMFTVMARINVESGLIFVQPSWQPLAVLVGLFGSGALGPRSFVILALLCGVLTIDPRECFMPFFVNGLRICQDARLKPAKVGGAAAVALVLGLAVATPVVLWACYNYGLYQPDAWAVKVVPTMPFDAAVGEITKLEGAGELARSKSLTTWERLAAISPDSEFLWWAGAGLALVLVFSVLRLRFTWWPLHPILFLVWGTYPMHNFHASFFLGFLVKAIVTKLGGGTAYNRVKALMIGVIAGDLLGGLIFMLAGAAHYLIRGTLLRPYWIFPG